MTLINRTLKGAASFTATLLLTVQAWCQANPALAYSEDGILYLMSRTGEATRRIQASQSIHDFALSPDAKSVAFNSAKWGDYGGPLYLLTVASGSVIRLTPPPAHKSEVYGDPEFSPDGTQLAIAVHAQAHGDIVEGSGPVAIISLATRQMSVVRATADMGGGWPAFSNQPHWSPDATRLLVNFEVFPAVVPVHAGKLRLLDSLMGGGGAVWAEALAWLGSRCVVYADGKDPNQTDRNPARVLNLVTGATKPASKVLGVPDADVTDIIAFSSDLWVRRDRSKLVVESGHALWKLPVQNSGRVIVRMVPDGHPGNVPEACR